MHEYTSQMWCTPTKQGTSRTGLIWDTMGSWSWHGGEKWPICQFWDLVSNKSWKCATYNDTKNSFHPKCHLCPVLWECLTNVLVMYWQIASHMILASNWEVFLKCIMKLLQHNWLTQILVLWLTLIIVFAIRLNVASISKERIQLCPI